MTVAGNTHLQGGAIVSGSGDLQVDTGTLTFADIGDHDQSSQTQGSLGVNVGVGAAGPGQPGFTIDGSYGDRTTEQVTRATISAGDIIINDTEGQQALEEAGATSDVANLNRDVDLAQEITRDEENYIGVYVSDTAVNSVRELAQAAIDYVGEQISAGQLNRATGRQRQRGTRPAGRN